MILRTSRMKTGQNSTAKKRFLKIYTNELLFLEIDETTWELHNWNLSLVTVMDRVDPFTTGTTLLYGYRFEPVKAITMHIVSENHFFTFPWNIEEMFSRYYMHGAICSTSKIQITQYCVERVRTKPVYKPKPKLYAFFICKFSN